MNSSEQALITEICQRLSHRQKGGHQWVHANHVMVWSPVVLMFKELQLSHRQKVEVGWLEWDTTLGCPQTFSGLLWP